MIKSATIIALLFPLCFCQFVMDFGMKPDVIFGEDNDRFDVESIIQDQSRMDVANPTDDYRRHAKNNEQSEIDDNITPERENEKDEVHKEKLFNVLRDAVGSLDINSFAHHSKMDSNLDNDEYEKNLRAFEERRSLRGRVDHLHKGHKSSRRGMPPDPEDDILFHYGVPVNVKIEGFLEVPLEEK